ncbi:PLP-dependent aminotransferase family protein [Rhizobium sp. SSA_523]|uniref:aminotransferase-like domain-containing protein n=1 Tax=Rhizobium sp. SSA_523 TaxID=2952477 RepID=UPI002090813D|nr:PLP-dependent aminotransferase family protein [Rhizobium sp. SSA_523]MCO5733224.1 PLP-dependent aminotransferase family protein [Rhizobium sp. SSA_523]WKC21789.1 PLP-dependent aminotransferase family protein [Rhizobium sp. SSA_523]
MADEDSKTEQIASRIALSIDEGILPKGTRLRSLRAAAEAYSVSKNTVVEAYDRLVARGYVEARHGAGYYVTGIRPRTEDPITARMVEAVDIATLLREQLEHSFTVRLGEGRPPAEWVEGSVLKSHLRNIASGQRGLFEHAYGSPIGFEPLRETLSRMLSERSIGVRPEHILLTLGANHAFDLIIRQYLRPGDVVLADSPGYYPLFAKLKLAGVRMLGVHRNADGPDPDDLARKAQASGARFFFTQSLAHNPTGGSLTLGRAHDILRIAERLDFMVVEDDAFGDLMSRSAARLAALDQLRRVIYVGTFAKILSASLRVGYVAASPETIGHLANMKMLTIVNSSGYVERIVHTVLNDGHYRHHLRRLGARVKDAQLAAVRILRKLGLRPQIEDTDGYYMWVELPPHVDDLEITRRAARESIFFAPGCVFEIDGSRTDRRYLRLNVAYVGDPRFHDFVRREIGSKSA